MSAAPAPAELPAGRSRWTVGTLLSPPFVTRGDDGSYGGISIELWTAVAESLGIVTEYRAFDYDNAGTASTSW